MRLRIELIAATCAALLFSACATADFRRGRIDVHGMVYDFENRPVAGYLVSLDGKEKAVSDAMGRYVIPSLPAGEYGLRGSREGFEDYEADVSVTSKTDIQYLRVASAEQLLSLADASLESGDLEEAASYVTRAEKTGTRSFLIPYYGAVIAFRSGQHPDALSILEALEEKGNRDPTVAKMKGDMEALTEGTSHEE